MRKKNEKNFWDMEIIGNRRKKSVTETFFFNTLKEKKSSFKSQTIDNIPE